MDDCYRVSFTKEHGCYISPYCIYLPADGLANCLRNQLRYGDEVVISRLSKEEMIREVKDNV